MLKNGLRILRNIPLWVSDESAKKVFNFKIFIPLTKIFPSLIVNHRKCYSSHFIFLRYEGDDCTHAKLCKTFQPDCDACNSYCAEFMDGTTPIARIIQERKEKI